MGNAFNILDGTLGGSVVGPPGSVSAAFLKPTAALAEAVPRNTVMTNLAGVLTSGTLRLVGIALPSGLLVSTITFLSGTTAAVLPTNQWFVLLDGSRLMLGVTGDDTTTAWGANATKTLTLAAAHRTTYAGLHYVGLMVAATTVPTLIGVSSTSVVTALVPMVAGQADTGMTTPPAAPFTAAAFSATSAMPYAFVS